MTLSQFIQKYDGKKVDWDGKWGGQCVDLFRFYCDEVMGILQPRGVIGAKNFWGNYDTDPVLLENFEKIWNTADFVPLEGDVMVWDATPNNSFGHIGVVSDNGATLSRFNSFDQNWTTISVCEIINHNYNNVFGVLRPREENMPEQTPLEACLDAHGKLMKEAKEKDDEIVRLKIDKAQLEEDVRTLNYEIESHECPIIEVPVDDNKWKANGKSETVVINGVSTTTNYAIDESE